MYIFKAAWNVRHLSDSAGKYRCLTFLSAAVSLKHTSLAFLTFFTRGYEPDPGEHGFSVGYQQ